MLNQVPPSIYIAIGALMAALIAGLFSYLNMIAAKENKVSEFRQEWINELRNEISILTSASQSLSYDVKIYRSEEIEDEGSRVNFLMGLNDRRERSIAALTKITLMLNYKQLQEKDSLEYKLMAAAESARTKLLTKSNDEIKGVSDEVRRSAGPLLKDNWEIVKKGEKGYNKIRSRVSKTLTFLFLLLGASIIILIYHAQKSQPDNQPNALTFEYKNTPNKIDIKIN